MVETFSLQEKKPGLTFHLATNFMNINSSKVVVLLSESTVRPQVERFYDPENSTVESRFKKDFGSDKNLS